MQQQPEAIDAAEVHRALESVLARPEYAPAEPSLLQKWLEAVGRWLSTELWPAILRLLSVPDTTDSVWSVMFAVLASIGALIGVAVLVYGAVRGVRWWRRRIRRSGHGGEAPVPVTAGDWRARARAAAERGDWRLAAHALYRATLLRLGEADVVRVDPSKTPGDYRREARQRGSPALSDLDAFLRWFERVAYGRDEPGPQHYARLADTASALEAHG
ncbi:MAG: DUF4129 domain-containing protein [Candidatus Longimicrobiales bacterium M2_2A_002]